MDIISQHLPKEGIFPLYMKYTEAGEICPRFRFFTFAAAIGSVVKRNVSFQRSSYALFPTLYPNPWVILVAPQGRGHKSASLRVAKNIITKLPLELQPRFLASKLTPEALIKALTSEVIAEGVLKTSKISKDMIKILRRKAQGLLYSSEFGVLLSKKDYNKDLVSILTDLYDTPDEWHSDTVMRGDQMLYEVCISIMGASTPDWMQTMLPADAFKGGFMSRLLLVAMPEKWSIRVADPEAPPYFLQEQIVLELKRIAETEGKAVWTPEAKGFFEDWYHSLQEPEPGVEASYLERKQDHLLRLAIILSLAESSKLILEKKHIESSLNLLDAIEKDTLRIVRYISIEPKVRATQRILELIEAKDCSESEILREVWGLFLRTYDYDESIRMLIRAKKVHICRIENGMPYYRKGKAK